MMILGVATFTITFHTNRLEAARLEVEGFKPISPTTSLNFIVKFMKPFLSVRKICPVILFLYPLDKLKRHFGVVFS